MTTDRQIARLSRAVQLLTLVARINETRFADADGCASERLLQDVLEILDRIKAEVGVIETDLSSPEDACAIEGQARFAHRNKE